MCSSDEWLTLLVLSLFLPKEASGLPKETVFPGISRVLHVLLDFLVDHLPLLGEKIELSIPEELMMIVVTYSVSSGLAAL